MNENGEKVLNQFFQPFYDHRINLIKNYDFVNNGLLDIPIALFWFSVIDFYGGLYSVGINNKVDRYRDGSIKLATPESFEKFVEDFFPSPENRFGKFLYKVFRSGIVHQISPKHAGISYKKDNNKLFIPSSPIYNRDSDTEIILNLFKLQELVYEAYNTFKRNIVDNQLAGVTKNIYVKLISNDIFEDRKVFYAQKGLLANELESYLYG